MDRDLLDIASSVELKSIRIAERSLCAGKKKDICQLSLFGTTQQHSTADRGVESWISFLRASRASLGALPANGEELMTSATYGPAHIELSKKSDPDLSCSKMCQGYESSCPWLSGTCAELSTPSKGPSLLPPPPWVRDILESASGYLPTTKASASGPDYARSSRPRSGADDLTTVLCKKYLPTCRHSDADRGGRGDLVQALRGNPNKHYMPTTSACDSGSNRGGGMGRTGPLRPSVRTLLKRTYLPTQTVCGNWNRKGASNKSGDGLATMIGGSPNLNWIDWYVGLPIGWSALESLETSRFQQWCERHGTSCAKEPPRNAVEDSETASNSRKPKLAKSDLECEL